MSTLINKIKEPSTLKGLAIVGAAVLIMLYPDAARILVILGAIGYGVVEVMRKERK